MTLTDVLTIGGAAVVTSIITQVIRTAVAWSPATTDRFGPALAVAVGVAVTLLAGAATGADLIQSGLTGLLAGASAVGLYDTVRSQR